MTPPAPVPVPAANGSGRFLLRQPVQLAQSAIGAPSESGILSNAVAGWIVQRAGYNAGFLVLAVVAAVATTLF